MNLARLKRKQDDNNNNNEIKTNNTNKGKWTGNLYLWGGGAQLYSILLLFCRNFQVKRKLLFVRSPILICFQLSPTTGIHQMPNKTPEDQQDLCHP